MGFPDDPVVKNPPANAGDAGDMGLIPWSGRSPRGGNGNQYSSFQYSCLKNPMDRRAWQATVYEVTESDITERLSMHIHIYNMINVINTAVCYTWNLLREFSPGKKISFLFL